MSTFDFSAAEGWFKRVYASESVDLVPEHLDLVNMIKFKKKDRVGDGYHFPVLVQRPHGVTYLGSSADMPTNNLNSPVAAQMKQARVVPHEMILQEDVNYGALSRAGAGSAASYGDIFSPIVNYSLDSMFNRLEMGLLYGQTSLGQIESVTDTSTSVKSFVITKKSWAEGIWAQAEGMQIDAYSTVNSGSPTNATEAMTVTSVNADTRTITVSHHTTDDGALDSAANDYLVPDGTFDGTNKLWFAGLDAIAENSSSLFDIDASAYSLWKANVKDASGAAPTLATFTAAAAKAATRAGKRERVVALSTYAWTDLNNSHVSLKRFADSSQGEISLGADEIAYKSASGLLRLRPCAMVKAGEAFIFDPKEVHRIGSSDIRFQPFTNGQQKHFLMDLESKPAVRFRIYTDQAIIHSRPASLVKIKNLVPVSLA